MENLEQTLKAAECGEADAQTQLGMMYSLGRGGVQQDYKKAFKWLSKAAEQGHILAQGCLGVAYARGEGVQQDYMKAFELTAKAAEKGNRDAQAFLGSLYIEGSGVQQNYQKAAEWFIKAAEQGAVLAQTNLGAMYAQGLGVQQNNQKAIEWLTKAAEQGNMDAVFNLGVIYTKQRDYKKAYELYSAIAFQGHANAQNMLGEMFFNGDWVDQDFEQAAAWFLKAAEQGHPLAIEGLQEIRRRCSR